MKNIHELVLYALSGGLYAVFAVRAWWHLMMRSPADIGQNHSVPIRERAWPRIMLVLALLSHGLLLHETVFRPDSMVFGFAYAISAMLWLGVGMYWLESLFLPLSGLGVLLLPSAALAVFLPWFAGGGKLLANPASPLFKIHFVIANMAYGMLALAAFHALLMLFIEQRLHGRNWGRLHQFMRWQRWLDAMPPLMTMERLLFRQISVGFVLLSLTIISGVLFAEDLFGHALRWDHKTLFALISWIMFAALLLGRYGYGWRGRAALRWVLASFVMLLFAYVGSRFVVEILLGRIS